MKGKLVETWQEFKKRTKYNEDNDPRDWHAGLTVERGNSIGTVMDEGEYHANRSSGLWWFTVELARTGEIVKWTPSVNDKVL